VSRGRCVALALLGAGLELFAVTRDWVQARVSGGGDVAVSGSTAAGVVTALAWVVAAGAVALTLARPRARRPVALVVLAAAVGSAAATAAVLADPVGALRPAVTSATGTTTAELSRVTATPWPWVALVAAALVGAATVVAFRSAGRWATPSRRYESAGTSASDVRDAWQALDRGEDPTATDPGPDDLPEGVAVDRGRGDLPQ
jgi:uncharacterized membrane protein (TIGR02234 family)